jgi:small conductance mechanosensitive channel
MSALPLPVAALEWAAAPTGAGGQVSEKVEACGPRGQQSWLCSTVFDLTDSTRAAGIADDFVTPLRIALIVLVSYVLVLVARRIIKRAVRHLAADDAQDRMQKIRRRTGLSLLDTTTEIPNARRIQRAETIGVVLRSVASIFIWGTALFMVLSELGIDLAPLIAGAGIVGLALGFGAQTLVRDFLSGMFMLFEDQFGVGDVVDAGFATGTVEGVSLRTTRLRDVEGVVWHIPNGQIVRIGNKSQQWSRALLDIAVAFSTDVALATDVIQRAADELVDDPAFSSLLLGRAEVWGIEDFGPDQYVVRLVLKTKPLEQWKVARELRARIKTAFDAAGIETPKV